MYLWLKFYEKILNRKNMPFSSAWWTQSSQVAVRALTEASTSAPNFIFSRFSQKWPKFGYFQNSVLFIVFVRQRRRWVTKCTKMETARADWFSQLPRRRKFRWNELNRFSTGWFWAKKKKKEFFEFIFSIFTKRIISDCGAKLAYRYRRNHGFWWWGKCFWYDKIEISFFS